MARWRDAVTALNITKPASQPAKKQRRTDGRQNGRTEERRLGLGAVTRARAVTSHGSRVAGCRGAWTQSAWYGAGPVRRLTGRLQRRWGHQEGGEGRRGEEGRGVRGERRGKERRGGEEKGEAGVGCRSTSNASRRVSRERYTDHRTRQQPESDQSTRNALRGRDHNRTGQARTISQPAMPCHAMPCHCYSRTL